MWSTEKKKKKSPSILWTRRFKYKKKNTHTLKKQRLSDTIIERECLWRRSVILVRVYSTCFRHIVWSKVSGTQLWFIFSFFSSCGDLNLDPHSGFRPRVIFGGENILFFTVSATSKPLFRPPASSQLLLMSFWCFRVLSLSSCSAFSSSSSVFQGDGATSPVFFLF